MRHVVSRCLCAVALCATAACGSGASSVPGSIANASGGGAPLGGSQNASQLQYAPVLLDGGVVSAASFAAGFNVASSTDTQSTLDAGTDTYVPSAGTAYRFEPPANAAGSHLITFSTTVPSYEQFFILSNQVPLTYGGSQPGTPTASTYGAIAFYENAPVDTVPGASYDLEISGSSGASNYDVRVGCVTLDSGANGGSTTQNIANTVAGAANYIRLVCALPKYGAPSGLYATVFTSTFVTSAKFLSATIQTPIVPGATGLFTPGAASYPQPAPTPPVTNSAILPTIAIVRDESGLAGNSNQGQGSPVPLPPSTGLTFDVDYLYAEPLPL